MGRRRQSNQRRNLLTPKPNPLQLSGSLGVTLLTPDLKFHSRPLCVFFSSFNIIQGVKYLSVNPGSTVTENHFTPKCESSPSVVVIFECLTHT